MKITTKSMSKKFDMVWSIKCPFININKKDKNHANINEINPFSLAVWLMGPPLRLPKVPLILRS